MRHGAVCVCYCEGQKFPFSTGQAHLPYELECICPLREYIIKYFGKLRNWRKMLEFICSNLKH